MATKKLTVGSLFSGIGGFDLAFNSLGAEIAWAVEIDKDCRRVLAHHFPDTEIHEDVKKVGSHNLTPVDLVCGGFPCQDLSVAGKRAGLDGERSGLWFEFRRIIQELSPQWVFIENVLGLLSSAKGRDFAVILSGLGECGYYASWRVLDAQYFGVPQRRRRVFIVGSLGNADCAKILFESSCCCGHPAPSRKAGERVAPTISKCFAGSGGIGMSNQELFSQNGGNLITSDDVVGALACNTGPNGHGPFGDFLNNQAVDAGHIVAFGGNRTSGPIDQDTACNARGGTGRCDFESETFVVGQINMQGSNGNAVTQEGDGPSSTLTHDNDVHAIVFAQNTRDEVRLQNGDGQIAVALAAEPGMKQQTYVACPTHEVVAPLMATAATERKHGDGGISAMDQYLGGHIQPTANMQVRRLTPLECLRLQGFSDDWLDIEPALSDSTKYRMTGNSVAVPVIRWIAKRIMDVTREL